MRKSIMVLVIFIIIFTIGSDTRALAHPGNTDSNGGHYCWTNCEEWGQVYGEYHYHDDEAIQPYIPTIEDNPKKGVTYQDGYNEAYKYWYTIVYSDLEDKVKNAGWEATWTDYSENYSKGFKDGFQLAIKDAQSDYKESEYNRGFEDGKKEWDMFQRLSGSELHQRSKEEPDYVRGYEDGVYAVKEKYSKIYNDITDVKVPNKFRDKQDSFIQGYKKGYLVSSRGFNYDAKDYKEFETKEDQEQYILGYRNGWNDEGGSLSLLSKVKLIYSNLFNYNKFVIFIPFILVIGIYFFVRRNINKL